MSKGTAVAVKEEAQLPVPAEQYLEDAGQGHEGIGAADIAIPFLGHIQALSKQLEEGHPNYLPDAKVGSFFNTVTGEIFSGKEGILVIPVERKKVVSIKTSKADGGKIVGTYATRAEAQQDVQPGQEVLDGYKVLVLYQAKSGAWVPAVLSMVIKSKYYTMLKWNALIDGLRVPGPNGTKIQPPAFAGIYQLTSSQLEFDEGTAAVLTAKYVGLAPDDAYALAKNLRKALAAGTVKIGNEEEPAAATQTEEDDDLPY